MAFDLAPQAIKSILRVLVTQLTSRDENDDIMHLCYKKMEEFQTAKIDSRAMLVRNNADGHVSTSRVLLS